MEKTSLPVVNIASPEWVSELAKITPVGEETTYYCLGYAASLAGKVLPSSTLVRLNSADDLKVSQEEEKGTGIAAVRAGDVVVSPRAHPSVKNSKTWMSPYHLELAEKLLSEGYEIELLDEQNNIVKKLTEKND